MRIEILMLGFTGIDNDIMMHDNYGNVVHLMLYLINM